MPEESEYSSIAERLVQSLASVSEPKMRSSVFFKKLCPLSDEGIVEVLNIIFNRANRERGLDADIIEIFLDQSELENNIGEERLRRLHSTASDKGYSVVIDLLGGINHLKDKEWDIREDRIYDFDERTIGERKSYASSSDPDMISKLIHDPEPMVVERLLQNPRVTEKDVLKIITRRPVNPELIKVVSNSQKWNTSYTVRDAIVRNPYSPASLALKILPSIMKQDLIEISRDGSLTALIRNRALLLLKQKSGNTEDFYIIEELDDSDIKNC